MAKKTYLIEFDGELWDALVEHKKQTGVPTSEFIRRAIMKELRFGIEDRTIEQRAAIVQAIPTFPAPLREFKPVPKAESARPRSK